MPRQHDAALHSQILRMLREGSRWVDIQHTLGCSSRTILRAQQCAICNPAVPALSEMKVERHEPGNANSVDMPSCHLCKGMEDFCKRDHPDCPKAISMAKTATSLLIDSIPAPATQEPSPVEHPVPECATCSAQEQLALTLAAIQKLRKYKLPNWFRDEFL